MSWIINVKDFIYYNRKYIFVILLFLLFILFNLFDNNKVNIVEDSSDIFINNESINDNYNSNIFCVDIKGEVNDPGTYEVDPNSRVIDVVLLAGGLTSDADTNSINLSKKVIDEMVIIIPKKGGEIENNTIANENVLILEENKVNDGKISINNSSLEELTTINGIGTSKAKAIIEYRNMNGNFKSIEDIMNVNGIGNSTFEKIKNFIKL